MRVLVFVNNEFWSNLLKKLPIPSWTSNVNQLLYVFLICFTQNATTNSCYYCLFYIRLIHRNITCTAADSYCVTVDSQVNTQCRIDLSVLCPGHNIRHVIFLSAVSLDDGSVSMLTIIYIFRMLNTPAFYVSAYLPAGMKVSLC